MDKKGQSYKISYKNSAGKNILEFLERRRADELSIRMLANNI